ncbi:hypothetical protein BV20DRAFT_983792 [Pilatotrama ljubarskyi]|nr:hypothetical protein BV20DRAFT_983792 [Pilatotrama ljubarskyi]
MGARADWLDLLQRLVIAMGLELTMLLRRITGIAQMRVQHCAKEVAGSAAVKSAQSPLGGRVDAEATTVDHAAAVHGLLERTRQGVLVVVNTVGEQCSHGGGASNWAQSCWSVTPSTPGCCRHLFVGSVALTNHRPGHQRGACPHPGKWRT